jgi:hypothetical protein
MTHWTSTNESDGLRLRSLIAGGRFYISYTLFRAAFTAVVRAFVPLLAGMLRMSSRQCPLEAIV